MNHAVLRYHLPPLAWALGIFAISSVPSYSIPNLSIFSQDKLLHAAVFFVFAFLLYRSLSHQNRFPALARRPKLWTVVGAAAYGITDEFHQLFVSGRSADYLDIAADIAGAMLLILLVWAVDAVRRRRSG